MTDENERNEAERLADSEIVRQPHYSVDVWINQRLKQAFVTGYERGCESMRAAMLRFGSHASDCPAPLNEQFGVICTCGFSKALGFEE